MPFRGIIYIYIYLGKIILVDFLGTTLLVYWLHSVDKITTILGCSYNKDAVFIQSFPKYSEINSLTWKWP
jgi:hypothetical protein